MKSRLASTVGFLVLFCMAADAQLRLEIPDTGWRLWLDTAAVWEHDRIYLPGDFSLSALPANSPTGGWNVLSDDRGIPVTLPATVEQFYWGADGFRPYREEYVYESEDSDVRNGSYLGVSWWWCDIDVPAAFKGKLVDLRIRGARLRAEIYLNGVLIGYNIITETSFDCDASAAIRPGARNRLAIRITNPGGRLDWLDTQLMRWGKTSQSFHKSHGFGGLDRGITLIAHDSLSFVDVWTLNRPDPQTVAVHAVLRNAASRPLTVKIVFEILDPNAIKVRKAVCETTVTVSSLNEQKVVRNLRVRDAQLWSDRHPKLYLLRAHLEAPGTSATKGMCDQREVTFGFRWFEANGVGTNALLRLNGDRIRLVSAISWGFWGLNGLWPTPQLAEREVSAAKAFGMNCLQFHRNVGKTEVFDAQDRMGLLRYMEPGGGQTSFGEKFSLYAPSPKDTIDSSGKMGGAATFAERYMEEKIVRMVRDHRSHPSLMLYCVQNEIHPDLHNSRVFSVLRRIHEEDPSRIVVLKSGFPSGSPGINQAWMESYGDVVHHDSGAAYTGWWDDHTVGGPGVWQDEMYKGPDDFTHRSANEREIVMWGEMLGAAVPDNHARIVAEIKRSGGTSYDLKDHTEILASYDAFLDRSGFRNAFATADALFQSIGNKSYDFWGRVIESARLAEANDYFVISGWESTAVENHSGLVDNLRNFKGDPNLIRTRLAPLRPVVKLRSLVVERGSSATVDLYVLNETTTGHARNVSLSLTRPDGTALNLGTFGVPPWQKDRFVYPAAMGIKTPALDKAGMVHIRLELKGNLPISTEDSILVVEAKPRRKLPAAIGVLTSQPSLHISPGLFLLGSVERYSPSKKYDLLIAADRFVKPPETGVDSTVDIIGTEDDELYRTIAYGDPSSLEFNIPGLPTGKATVTLKFAELFQNAENMRVFDVALNGDTVLRDFDVFKAAGGKNIAFDTTFAVTVRDGLLRVTFPRVPKPSARICAVKVQVGEAVVAIKAGRKSYRDREGVVWAPYEAPRTLTADVLARVRAGTPLIVLGEGEPAVDGFAKALAGAGAFRYAGVIGEARASWMGSWYFVRRHPLYDGLPVDCSLGSYYQVPVTNACGVLVDGPGIEVVAAYSRDHDRNIGAGSVVAKLGAGTVVIHTIPGIAGVLIGNRTGMQPVVACKLLFNSIDYLAK